MNGISGQRRERERDGVRRRGKAMIEGEKGGKYQATLRGYRDPN